MCRQLEIWTKFFLPNFGSNGIELLELPLEIMFLTYFNNIFAAESIKNRLKRVQKLYKKSIVPEVSSFSSITVILIWIFIFLYIYIRINPRMLPEKYCFDIEKSGFFRQFDQNQFVVNYFYFLKYT
jgi:cytochrome b subunit of formate dehydrogenase